VILEESQQGKGRVAAADRLIVAELVERAEEAHMVQVRVADYDSVNLLESHICPVQAGVGIPVVPGTGMDSAVEEDLALRRLHQEAGPPHLLKSAESLDRDLLRRCEARAEDGFPQVPQKELPHPVPRLLCEVHVLYLRRVHV